MCMAAGLPKGCWPSKCFMLFVGEHRWGLFWKLRLTVYFSNSPPGSRKRFASADRFEERRHFFNFLGFERCMQAGVPLRSELCVASDKAHLLC